MKRVIYGVNMINGVNILNRKMHLYCRKYIGMEILTSADYTAFYKEVKNKVEQLNAENPRCTPLGTALGNDYIRIYMKGRLNDLVASLELCTVKSTYTAEYGKVSESELIGEKGGKE